MDIKQLSDAPKGSDFLSEKPYLYIFPVGQGACNLIVHTDEDNPRNYYGIMYDCGTSGTGSLPILWDDPSNPFQSQEYYPFFSEQRGGPLYKRDSPHPVIYEEGKKDIYFADRFLNIKQIQGSKEAIEQRIRNTISELNFKSLLVFLSHPDKDHINLLHKVIPDNLTIFVFLCGDFFGKGGAESMTQKKLLSGQAEAEDTTGDIRTLLEFLRERKKEKTHFDFPYYWGLHEAYGDICYKLPTDQIFTLASTVVPQFYSGSLNGITKGFCMQSWAGIPQKLLERVYFWSLNDIDEDPNNQSAIISYNNQDGYSFVFTGDAHDSVFKRISQRLAVVNPEIPNINIERVRTGSHNVMLMLPHHGSRKNISETMLDMFLPSAVFVNAGYGSQFTHPSAEAIDFVGNWAKKWTTPPQEEFWKSFVFENDTDFISLMTFPEYNIQNTGNVMRFTYGDFPVFCTNTEGGLKFTDKGFYRTFSPYILYGKCHTLSKPYVHTAIYNPDSEKLIINPAYLDDYKKVVDAENRIEKQGLINKVNSKDLKSLTTAERDKLIALNIHQVGPVSGEDKHLITSFYNTISEISEKTKVEKISANTSVWKLTLPNSCEIICYGIAVKTNKKPSENILYLMELMPF